MFFRFAEASNDPSYSLTHSFTQKIVPIFGAGKSTAMSYIEERLRDAGVDLICTREPGGTSLGEQLRETLLAPTEAGIAPLAELLMMFAARAQHLSECILPALRRGQWVLCDRFTDATYAYQGAGRNMGEAPVALLEEFVQGDLRPDVTLLLDVPADLGLSRARGRGALDRFELEDLAFFERVRQSYLSRARRSSGRYQIIDASAELADVERALQAVVKDLIACPPLVTD
ncbi:thymidylate kinase [Congregibacter litoralis KT71]|uniref:Thymidylate kinase n=1 Tax=Congregibacter litoralis KT71 TaxID=314285 RepID=A4A8H4_9GAMM|nr:thymidylate kinase [Congregibacter litoralis KT71]